MDSLVSRYALILARHDRLRGLGWDMFELRAAKPLNTIALADRFAHAAPVVSAAPDSWIGGGDDIAATRVAGGWRLDYSVSWGDCPAGCIYGHVWSFVVSDAGDASFVGERGPAPPVPSAPRS